MLNKLLYKSVTVSPDFHPNFLILPDSLTPLDHLIAHSKDVLGADTTAHTLQFLYRVHQPNNWVDEFVLKLLDLWSFVDETDDVAPF